MSDKATGRATAKLMHGPHYKTDVLDEDGNVWAVVCPTFTPLGEERARLIVRSVNNAERLAEALRALLDGKPTHGEAAAALAEWDKGGER